MELVVTDVRLLGQHDMFLKLAQVLFICALLTSTIPISKTKQVARSCLVIVDVQCFQNGMLNILLTYKL